MASGLEIAMLFVQDKIPYVSTTIWRETSTKHVRKKIVFSRPALPQTAIVSLFFPDLDRKRLSFFPQDRNRPYFQDRKRPDKYDGTRKPTLKNDLTRQTARLQSFFFKNVKFFGRD